MYSASSSWDARGARFYHLRGKEIFQIDGFVIDLVLHVSLFESNNGNIPAAWWFGLDEEVSSQFLNVVTGARRLDGQHTPDDWTSIWKFLCNYDCLWHRHIPETVIKPEESTSQQYNSEAITFKGDETEFFKLSKDPNHPALSYLLVDQIIAIITGSGRALDFPKIVAHLFNAETLDLLQRVRTCARNRRLFFLSDKRLGLCANVEVGDLVTILFGSSLPVVLRPSADMADYYTVVGQAYVDGMCDGEAVDGLNNGQFSLKTFKLV
jgi:hypothetical protein